MKSWFEITLWKRVMLGLALGVALGLVLYNTMGQAGADLATTWIYPVGRAFISLIKMLVVPLIFLTLVSGVTAMGDPSKLGSLGGRAIGAVHRDRAGSGHIVGSYSRHMVGFLV